MHCTLSNEDRVCKKMRSNRQDSMCYNSYLRLIGLLSSSYDRLIPPPTIMSSVEHHRNLVKEDACHYLSATDLPVCRSSCQFRSPVSRSKFNTGHSLSCFNELCFRCLHRMTKKLHSFVSQISFFVVRTDPFSAIRHIPQTLTILSSLHVAILVVRQPYIQYHERNSSTTSTWSHLSVK